MGRMAARGRSYPATGQYGRYAPQTQTVGILAKTLSSLTGSSAATTLTWSATVPAVSFTYNAGVQTHDLTQYTSGFNSSLYGIRVYTGTLPTGVTLSAAGVLTYDGTSPVSSATGISYEIYTLATADWTQRSTASGVVFADAWDTLPSVTSSSTPPVSNGSFRFANDSRITLE